MITNNNPGAGRRTRGAQAVARAWAVGVLALGHWGPASALDLAQSFEAARAQDATLAAAEAAYRAGSEALPQAKAGLGPTVQAGGSYSRISSQASGSAAESGSNTSASLGGSLPLYRPAARLAVQQAEARGPALDAQLRKARQDLILRVAQAYFAVLQALDNLEAAASQRDALEAQRRQAVRAYAIGTGTVIEEAEAKARHDLMVATILRTQGELQVARRALEQLTGAPVTALARLAAAEPGELANGEEATWLDTANRHNADIVQAQAQLAAQRYDVDIAKTGWWPTLELTASASRTRSSRENLNLGHSDGRSASVGVNLAVPIWESGLRDSKLRQAQALVDQSDQLLVAAKRDVELTVRQALTNLASNVAQAKALELAVQSSQVSLQASERGREVGSRTVLDVLNARQQLYAARTQLTGSRYAAVLAMLQLKAAAGVIGEADLLKLTDAGQTIQLTGDERPAWLKPR